MIVKKYTFIYIFTFQCDLFFNLLWTVIKAIYVYNITDQLVDININSWNGVRMAVVSSKGNRCLYFNQQTNEKWRNLTDNFTELLCIWGIRIKMKKCLAGYFKESFSFFFNYLSPCTCEVLYIHIYIYVWVCVCVCMCVRIYIYIYIYIYNSLLYIHI